MTDLLTTSTLGSNVPDPDADCTRTAVGARDFQRPRIGPCVPSGATPLVRRRIKPVPPGPAVTFIPFPDPDDAEPADAEPADDWDRRADRLQWWMADLGGPHPVTVETTENPVGASRTLEHTLRRFGVDVIEANETLIKGLLPAPPERAVVRMLRWAFRRSYTRLEVVEIRFEQAGPHCRVSARAGGERAAEALRVALSDLPPAPR